jgi:hypothetical protein
MYSQSRHDIFSRIAFLESLRQIGFTDVSENDISIRPYQYWKGEKKITEGFYHPYPREGFCRMYIIYVELGMFRIVRFEYPMWELSPMPVIDFPVWFIGDIVCKGIRSFTSLLTIAKSFLPCPA